MVSAPETPSGPGFPAEEIWRRLDPAGLFKGDWLEFRHRQQGEFLHELAKYAPIDIGLSHIGQSDEGRVLQTLRFGTGPRKVMIWARQHGDEPDCTAALSMALCELILRSEEPQYAFILERLELGVLPMVNPDGVARFTRRNAQGLDLNRDAVALTGLESRAMILMKESLKPEFCFNLHDMNSRKATPDGHLVALAFQAGPFEKRDIDNPVRLKAKKICGIMADAALVHAPDGVSRYAADYMHRAFGDSMMRFGVSSMLIEAGGARDEEGGDDFVRRLFALALLRGLYAVAAGEDQPAAEHSYDTLPFDTSTRFADLIVEKALVLNGMGRPPFRADVALNADRVAGRYHEPTSQQSRIENLGDLEDDLAKRRLAMPNSVVMPGLVAVAPGLKIDRQNASEHAEALLRAGITTVACGFGPFESARARERWLEEAATWQPPVNVVAFERASSLLEIRTRHAMTELAGLLVQDLMISPEDLLNFTHLFHPAHHSAIEAAHSGKMIGVDVYFQGSASPADTHLHLHLTHVDGRSGHTPVRSEELRALVDQFLRDPSQITLSQDAVQDGFDWLPMMVGYGGLSQARLPEPDFLGRIMKSYGAEEGSGLVAIMNMVALNNARAFRLGNLGRIEIGQRADLVAFNHSEVEGGRESWKAQPHWVMLNGRTVLESRGGPLGASQGSWFFAARPQSR